MYIKYDFSAQSCIFIPIGMKTFISGTLCVMPTNRL